MTTDDFTTKSMGAKGRLKRSRFGIVHYVTGTRQSFLVIPANSGISIGDRISFYVNEGSISFRVEADGMYSVFKPTTNSATMRCSLCPELKEFAHHRVRDIEVRTILGGWSVPMKQFD